MNHNHPEDDQRHESDLQECCDEIKTLRTALAASTELLRGCVHEIWSEYDFVYLALQQIATNEAVLAKRSEL